MSVSKKAKVIMAASAAVLAVGAGAGVFMLGGKGVSKAETAVLPASQVSSEPSITVSDESSLAQTAPEVPAEPEKLNFVTFK